MVCVENSVGPALAFRGQFLVCFRKLLKELPNMSTTDVSDQLQTVWTGEYAATNRGPRLDPQPECADTARSAYEAKAVVSAGKRTISAYMDLAERALASDADVRDEFAQALVGKSASRLSERESRLLDMVIREVAASNVAPDFLAVSQGNLTSTDADTLLAAGSDSAFVPGANGDQGTILLSRSLVGSPALDAVAWEEMGEAIAQRAAYLGLGVH